MILGDKNRNLLISQEHVVICRENSFIKYSQDLKKEYTNTALSMPRSFNDKLYDYSNNKIISLQTQEHKEFNVDPIIEYFKEGKEFYFIKQLKNLSYSLLNNKGVQILNFKTLYTVSENHFYYLDGLKVMRMNLSTSEKNEIITFCQEPVTFCAKYNSSQASELIAFADSSNKIHIYQGKSYRMYHWMCNKILNLKINDEYVVAVSKSGDAAQFHIKLQNIEHLFKFYGYFLDIKIKNNKIYFLTSFEFKIFDLMTNNVQHNEYLIPIANFQTSVLKKFVNTEETDIFRIKRKSTVEIINLIKNQQDASLSSIYYTNGMHTFIFNPKIKEVTSVFQMDCESNYTSGSHVFSVSQRKSNYIVNIYDLYLDRLVLNSTMNINSKTKLRIKNIFFVAGKLYVQTETDILVLNRLNILEFIIKANSDSVIRRSDDSLFISDDKGIFNISKEKYEIKQKSIKKYCFYKSKIIFFIENKGIYLDIPDRKQILEINNVIDLCIKETNESVILSLIYHHPSGKVKLAQYCGLEAIFANELNCEKLDDDINLKLIDEVDADTTSNHILPHGIFSTRQNRLLI